MGAGSRRSARGAVRVSGGGYHPSMSAHPHPSSFAVLLGRLRDRLVPEPADRGWPTLWNLAYLCFLFANWTGADWRAWLPLTLLSILVFLPLYFAAIREGSRHRARTAAMIALLGFALLPLNSGANTYLIYAGAMVGGSGLPRRTSLQVMFAGLAAYVLELWLLGWPTKYIALSVVLTGILAIAIGMANHHHRERRLRQAELMLSHDEVRRLAALAERERIGRDLHDLLGHTLSLITLKSELATRLFERDPQAARREIADVERVARDALGQVRRAVTGIRSAGLAAELASARLLLESDDVRLDYALDGVALPPDIETVFALMVREAVTNVQRHAHASRVSVEIEQQAGETRLLVVDDGIGGVIVPGTGLCGMRERLELLGGRLEIVSVRGRGTRLLAALPLAAADAAWTTVPEA